MSVDPGFPPQGPNVRVGDRWNGYVCIALVVGHGAMWTPERLLPGRGISPRPS